MESERNSSFDVFASSNILHYRLGRPFPTFSQQMKRFDDKMAGVKWVVEEITTGQFGCQMPQRDPTSLNTFLLDNNENLVNVACNWDFIYEKVHIPLLFAQRKIYIFA